MNYLAPTIADNITLNLIKSGDKTLHLFSGAYAFNSMSKAIEKNGIAVGNSNWNILTTIAGIFSGLFIWNEKISEKKILGIILGLSGLYFMS